MCKKLQPLFLSTFQLHRIPIRPRHRSFPDPELARDQDRTLAPGPSSPLAQGRNPQGRSRGRRRRSVPGESQVLGYRRADLRWRNSDPVEKPKRFENCFQSWDGTFER